MVLTLLLAAVCTCCVAVILETWFTPLLFYFLFNPIYKDGVKLKGLSFLVNERLVAMIMVFEF